jgi:peptidoglycan hydrolase-like protein with peptidoglycan-binding domain
MTLTGDEPDLGLGETGEWVIMLQVRLYGLRIFQDFPDGSYGMSTENAVRVLQTQLGHTPTGEVDRETWEALLHQEQQVGINYQYQSPYDALAQLRYDLEHGGQRDGWGNHFEGDQQDGSAEQSPQTGQLSPDGQWRWDGSDWQAADGQAAGSAGSAGSSSYVGQLSDDGQWRWDGSDWQAADGQSAGSTASSGSSTYVGQLSDDGAWRWDGNQWESAAGGGDGHLGQLSDDGRWRWDGSQWQAA